MFGTDVNLELTRPWLLLWLLVVPWLFYFFYRTLIDFTRLQQRLSLLIRCVILLLLVLALAGLTLLRPTDRQFVIVAVDRSLSIGDKAGQVAREFVDQLRDAAGDNGLAFVEFATAPSAPVENADELTALQKIEGDTEDSSSDPEAEQQQRQARMGSNLEAAIEVATAAIPPFHVPHVVILTDGNETQGDALRAALAGDVPVSPVPLPTRDEPEVQVADVVVPAQVRQGEPFYVEVTINSNHDDQGVIDVYRGDVKIDIGESANIKIKKGENKFRFRQEVADQRQVEYAVRISGFKDKLLDNNSLSGLVSASGKPRVLLVESDVKTTDPLRWALEEQDIRVDIRPPEGIPESLSDLQNYEAVLLSNVPATSLSIRQMEVMRTYVQDLGGGLLMLGGDQSFGLGGYYKTTLEEILPVRSDFEKEKEKPSLAMVLVIDRSGSMGGMKIELAKDAAKGAVELLGAREEIGVIAFDNQSYWVSELHSAADKNYVIERISTIESAGGTNMYPAMVEAFEALQSAVAKLKHVILLTDGISAPGDFQGITADMVASRMTVSTVAVGNGADRQLLDDIAQQGNGRHYFCDDPQTVPQIFAKETVTASKSAINELPFVPQRIRPTPVLRTLDLESAPFLLGFVVTRPKPTCEFILATETGEPLLAWWRYGLGMTVAFTSDAKSRWAAEWLTWPQFGTFWAQVVRHVMRKGDARGVYVQVQRKGNQTEVRLDAVDPNGRFRNQAETKLSIIGPEIGTEKQEVTMNQVAPGQYVAHFETNKEGAYHLDIAQMDGSQLAFRQNRGLVVGYPDELRLRPTNETLLRKIAEVSGGKYDAKPEEVFDIGDQRANEAKPLWPYLLTAAMLLFLADVALRRIDFSLIIGGRSENWA